MEKLKKIMLAVLVMAVVLLSGCTKSAGSPTYEMTIVDNTTSYKIYKHDKTGVYYFAYNGKGVCVMVNADGTPYTGE